MRDNQVARAREAGGVQLKSNLAGRKVLALFAGTFRLRRQLIRLVLLPASGIWKPK